MHFYVSDTSPYLRCPMAAAGPSICPNGTFSTAGKTICSNCSKGFKCPYNGMDSQVPCGNGTFSISEKSVRCETCPAGHACPRREESPVKCENGTYSIGASSECRNCPAGYR